MKRVHKIAGMTLRLSGAPGGSAWAMAGGPLPEGKYELRGKDAPVTGIQRIPVQIVITPDRPVQLTPPAAAEVAKGRYLAPGSSLEFGGFAFGDRLIRLVEALCAHPNPIGWVFGGARGENCDGQPLGVLFAYSGDYIVGACASLRVSH